MAGEMQQLIESVAQMREFSEGRLEATDGRVGVMQDEMSRMADDLKTIIDSQKRGALLRQHASTNIPKMVGGRYDGLDVLDLFIVRSIAGAFGRIVEGVPPESRHDWERSQTETAVAMRELLVSQGRALDDVTVGAGDELVPTAESNQLWMDVHLATVVAQLFTSVPMPTNPFEEPLDLGDFNWYPGTANIASKSTDPTTSKRTLTAHELVTLVPWSYNLDEDSVIAMLPSLRAKMVQNSSEVMDDVVLNADTTVTNNINADGATITNTDAGKGQWLLGFDGLRHIALVDNTSQGIDHNAAVSDAMFNSGRLKLGKYGVRSGEVAFIADINTYIKSLTVSNFRTLDKLGVNATLLTGQLGQYEGAPVLVSEQLVLADTDGFKTDAGNVTDTGSLLCVNRTQYRKGFRRQLLIETNRNIEKRQTVMVASFRMSFEGRNANASDTASSLTYDITGVTS